MQQDSLEKKRQRADLMLVERGAFATRAQAQAAIAAGLVRADGELVRRASQGIAADAAIEASAEHPYASRGGMKLAAALDGFGIDPAGLACLDIGASTGGFTDVLLLRGAAHVTAVDVGRDQFIARLREDARVTLLEGTDARSLSADMLAEPPALIVADVSFISIAKVLPSVLPLAARGARLVALIKPQFEVGRGNVGKGGIVRDPAQQEGAVVEVIAAIAGLGWTVGGQMPSPIDGGDGNKEFLVWARNA